LKTERVIIMVAGLEAKVVDAYSFSNGICGCGDGIRRLIEPGHKTAIKQGQP
jgi:hypothetical protein